MLSVSVRNFGPISEGTVRVAPLTIFIGPSNSGKSYFAMLLHSLMQAYSPALALAAYPFSLMRYRSYQRSRLRRTHRIPPDMAELWADTEALLRRADLRTAVQQWSKRVYESPNLPLYEAYNALPEELRAQVDNSIERSIQSSTWDFGREVQRYYGKLPGLISRFSEHRELRIELHHEQPYLRLELQLQDGELNITSQQYDITTLQAPSEQFGMPPSLLRSDMAFHEFVATCSSALFAGFARESYYLPAARSGIAQGHKAIASILVRQSPLAAIEPLEVPTLAGIITDFIGNMLSRDRDRRARSSVRNLMDVVTFMENRVLRGIVDIEEDPEVPYPEIYFEPLEGQPHMGKFALPRTSSMVSELGPVVLFLKYLVGPGDLVILEEPESHLHPAVQRDMARVIVRLVNRGVRVLITTHSDFFVGQLNNLILLTGLSGRRLKTQGYEEEDRLHPSDVGVYAFSLPKRETGSIVTNLPVTIERGIPEDEFVGVSESLYREAISLEQKARR